MADLVQLDKAAALVGKSEVTLRRLIKAGKIPYQKEKTLTGFIYLVNPANVRNYYHSKDDTVFEADPQPIRTEAAPEPAVSESRSSGGVRVAIAGESGSAQDYWQKKSERYEEKYNTELINHSQTREELGVWRGRAEQAQSMLMKLLPAPQEIEVGPSSTSAPAASQKQAAGGNMASALITILSIVVVLVVAVGGVVFLYTQMGA